MKTITLFEDKNYLKQVKESLAVASVSRGDSKKKTHEILDRVSEIRTVYLIAVGDFKNEKIDFLRNPSGCYAFHDKIAAQKLRQRHIKEAREYGDEEPCIIIKVVLPVHEYLRYQGFGDFGSLVDDLYHKICSLNG